MTKDFFHPGSALTLSSLIIQIGITIFVLLGVSLYFEENKYTVLKYSGYFSKIIGKLIFLLCFIIILISIYILIFFLFIFLNDLSLSSFYLDSALYISLYWGVPFFIAFITGNLFGILLKKRIYLAYFIATFTTFLIGPVNTLLYDFKLAALINLGQRENVYFYHPQYGYMLEATEIYKRMLILCFLLSILLACYLIKVKTHIKIISLTIVFTLLISLILGNKFSERNNIEQKISLGLEKNNEVMKEFDYYRKNKSNFKVTNNSNIKPYLYSIKLNTEKGFLESRVKIHFSNLIKSKDPLVLNLYHGFNIESVKLNGQLTDFNRKGDFISINTNKLETKNTILISYQGKSSPLFLANSNAIYLPNYFAWLPSFNLTPSLSYENGELHRNFSQNQDEILYTLNFQGNQKIYTNIDEKEKDIYEGRTTTGLSLVAGDISKQKINKDTVIYPNTWENGLKNYKQFDKFLSSLEKQISSILQIKSQDPKEIFLIPNTYIFDHLYEENFWVFKDHWILSFPQHTSFNKEALISNKAYIINSAVPAFTWKNKKEHSNHLEFDILFDSFFAAWIAEKVNVSNTDQLSFTFEQYKLYYSENKKILEVVKILEGMSQEVDKINPKLFRDWYKLVLKDKGEWNTLKEYLNKQKIGDEND